MYVSIAFKLNYQLIFKNSRHWFWYYTASWYIVVHTHLQVWIQFNIPTLISVLGGYWFRIPKHISKLNLTTRRSVGVYVIFMYTICINATLQYKLINFYLRHTLNNMQLQIRYCKMKSCIWTAAWNFDANKSHQT